MREMSFSELNLVDDRELAYIQFREMYTRMKDRFDYLYYVPNPTEEEILECRVLGSMLGRY